MKKGTLFFCFISVILIIQAVFTVKTFYFTERLSSEIHSGNIPINIGAWSGIEYPVEEYVIRILETEDILYRKYSSALLGDVFLSIVFSEDNRKIVHPPEVCYSGGGWDVTATRSLIKQFAGKKVGIKELLIEQGTSKQVVWYFLKAGERLTNNYHSQQLRVGINMLLGKKGHAALIRFSCSYGGNISQDDARASMKAFIDASLDVILEKLP